MTTTRTRPFRHRLAVAAVTAPLALALVACGDSDDDSDDGAAVSAPTSAAPTSAAPSTDTTDDTTDAATDAPTSAPAGGGDLLTAAATGLGAVEGGTVFSVGREDGGGWEVSVVDADGTEFDVRVAADGTTVEGQPVEDTDDGDDASRDADERQRLLDVSLDYTAAVDAAAASGGTEVTGVELDEENGTATWEVQYDEDSADELTVTVDANSGDVLNTERDD